MRNELEKLLSELRGMQRILDLQANSFPIKNKAWIQSEVVDDVAARIQEILSAKGVLD